MSTPYPLDLVQDFGGDGPVLHLAHANGFPPGTYRLLIERLTEAYHVVSLPARPLWPGSRPESAPNWHPMAADLAAGLSALELHGIVGVGHSLGGVLSLYAAVAHPDLFRAVVLIDPVILPDSRLRALRLLRLLRPSSVERHVPLVRLALRRRRTWASREECFDHLAEKPFFAAWPPASLQAYVESGTRPRPDGQVELVYPPEWEAHIFATTPTDVWRYVARLAVRSLWIRGEHSTTFCDVCLARVGRLLPAAGTAVIPDSDHMVPVQRPDETAEAILGFLGRV